MDSGIKEKINSYITKYYNDYYHLLTTGEENDFSEETLTGEENWTNAFRFIMGHLMLRGRNDKLSSSYKESYLQILKLDRCFDRDQIREIKTILAEFINLIEERKKSGKLKNNPVFLKELAEKFGVKIDETNNYKLNPKDLKMIDGLLSYQTRLFDLGRNNMFDHLADLIQQTNVMQAYTDLIEISNVGDKLAAFTLRDIVFLSTKCHSIRPQICDYLMLFPVDTWVEQGGKKILGISGNERISPHLLKFKLINLCAKVASQTDPLIPLKFNAGMWYHLMKEKASYGVERKNVQMSQGN